MENGTVSLRRSYFVGKTEGFDGFEGFECSEWRSSGERWLRRRSANIWLAFFGEVGFAGVHADGCRRAPVSMPLTGAGARIHLVSRIRRAPPASSRSPILKNGAVSA